MIGLFRLSLVHGFERVGVKCRRVLELLIRFRLLKRYAAVTALSELRRDSRRPGDGHGR